MPRARRAVETASSQPIQPRRADGVDYVEDPAAPGLAFFACDMLSARLSTKGCANRWVAAQGGRAETHRQLAGVVRNRNASNAPTAERSMRGATMLAYEGDITDRDCASAAVAASDGLASSCRSCPIGAAHAGREHVTYSTLYRASICPRCRRGATRMIQDRVCVSCYNREAELLSGRNARGNEPSVLKRRPLHSVTMRVLVDGRATRQVAARVVDTFEAQVQTLRRTKGQVAFAFSGYAGGLRQARLF